jgi:hypothetical protein
MRYACRSTMRFKRNQKLRRNDLRAATSPFHAPTRCAALLSGALATVAMASGCRGCHDIPEPLTSTPAETLGHRSASPGAAPSVVEPRDKDNAGPPPDPAVDAIVRSQIEPEATHCYAKGLQKDAKQSGTVVLMIKLMPDGKVDTVGAGADGALAVETVDCIQWVAKRAVFDPPGDAGRMIRVALTFPR